MLGGAVGIPFIADAGVLEAGGPLHQPSPLATAGPPPRSGEEWSKALTAFRSADAEIRGFERATAGSSAEAEEVWLPVYEDQLDAFCSAVRGVMLAGAPDFAAFASKLELFFDHELEPHSVDEDILAALRADTRRLAR